MTFHFTYNTFRFLEKLTESKDKPFKLKQARPNVTRMCEFVHFDVFLANCGYYVEVVFIL